jgi:hypothetical protein
MKQLKKSVLNWLSTLQPEQDHLTTSSQIPEGSGKWFLDLPELIDWFSGEVRLLWCYGIRESSPVNWLTLILSKHFLAGAGKTAIA